MASPKFDTTQIKQNAPGLTYGTPQAMPAKYNSLTGMIEATEDLIPLVTGIDKSMTLDEASQTATDLSEDYLTGSITNQSILKQKEESLLKSLSGDITEDEKLQWEIELDALTKKHKSAELQGMMSPYEMQSRMQAASSDLIERNPAYANEIVKKFSDVFARTNVTNLLDADIKFVEAQQAAKAADDKDKRDYLTRQKIYWRGLDPEEFEIAFRQEKMREESSMLEARAAEAGVQLEESQKLEKLKKINKMYPATGIYGAVEHDITALSIRLEAVQNDPNLTTEVKNQTRERAIIAARKKLDYFIATIPSRNDYEIKNLERLRESTIKNIDAIEAAFKRNVGTPVEELKKIKDSAELVMSIDAYKEGYNPVFEKRLQNRLKVYEVFKTSKSLLAAGFSIEEIEDMKQGLVDFISTGGAKVKTDKAKAVFSKLNMVGSIRDMSILAQDELQNDGTIAIPTLGMINNIFVKAEGLVGDARLDEEDKLISTLTTQINNDVFNVLMQNSDFSTSVMENMEFYKEAIKTTIPEGTELTMRNGLFYSNDSRMNKNAVRLNNYILLKSKMEGKKPSQISEEILTTDFPMFNIQGQTKKEEPIVETPVKTDNLTDDELLEKYR